MQGKVGGSASLSAPGAGDGVVDGVGATVGASDGDGGALLLLEGVGDAAARNTMLQSKRASLEVAPP